MNRDEADDCLDRAENHRKNFDWDEAKECYEKALEMGRLPKPKALYARRQLAIIFGPTEKQLLDEFRYELEKQGYNDAASCLDNGLDTTIAERISKSISILGLNYEKGILLVDGQRTPDIDLLIATLRGTPQWSEETIDGLPDLLLRWNNRLMTTAFEQSPNWGELEGIVKRYVKDGNLLDQLRLEEDEDEE